MQNISCKLIRKINSKYDLSNICSHWISSQSTLKIQCAPFKSFNDLLQGHTTVSWNLKLPEYWGKGNKTYFLT